MNQELDTTNQQAPATGMPMTSVNSNVLEQLRLQVEAWSAAAQIAERIARTDFAGPFKNKPADMAAAILKGATLGIPPESIGKSIYVVHGTPMLYGKTALAIALSHGYETETIEDSAKAVTVRMISPKGRSMEVRYTIERATREGLVKGNKVQYETRPSKMLYWKCIGELTDRMIPHLTGGMPVKEDWEQSPTNKVTATRLDQPSRGASGLKAALGMGETGRQEEPQQADEPAPVDAEFLADIQSTVASFTTTDDINTFADGLKAEGDVPDEVKDIIMSRYNELKEQ
ncbi:hypothetical protein [Corynebacterium macginleyi]|uniref:hypothetical protein n=1 Tax=Corynebacterium macginleyi TaxID=38290 RepID=UPI000EFA19EB|nr:hypothetical protein [Corynebacterium macginleyi]QRP20942.1 hypothetical protein I6J25_09675 [Corynebacterium macginleyi]RMB65519.1 hypothetical protein D9V82_08330 [Corynebacterium macginleyi]